MRRRVLGRGLTDSETKSSAAAPETRCLNPSLQGRVPRTLTVTPKATTRRPKRSTAAKTIVHGVQLDFKMGVRGLLVLGRARSG
eukprot:3711021-Rhodomonas_salina.1